MESAGKGKSATEVVQDYRWVVIHLVKGGGMCWLALADSARLKRRACVEVKTVWATSKLNSALLSWNLVQTQGKKAEYTFEKVMDDWKVEYEAAVNAGEKACDVQSRQQAAEQHRSEIKQRLRTRVLPERESDEPFGDPKLFPVVGAPPETPTKVKVSRIIPSWLGKG